MIDLSGVTGTVLYRYDSVANSSISLLAMVIFLIFAALIVSAVISKSKSKEYRELLSDMYVVGMIKKFAKEDSIDLVAELKEFARIEKKSKLSIKGIDSAIEDELKEKIAKVSEDHTNKK